MCICRSGKFGQLGTRCTLLRPGILEYQDAWELQRRIAEDVRAGADPTLILLEHPPTYTLGARGATEHLLLAREAYARRGAAVVHSDRGGDVTFHGPGQIVGYPIMDLRKRGMGPVRYVCALEAMLIDALRGYGIDAGRREGARGVWAGTSKVAAIGVRVTRGVSMHGFGLNVNTDLSWFDDIVPCGIRDGGVTSMAAIAGETFDIGDVMRDVASAFGRVFGVEVVDGGQATDGSRGERTTDNRQQTTEGRGAANGERQTANSKQQTEAGRLTALRDATEATSLRSGFGGDAAGGVGSRGGRGRHGGDGRQQTTDGSRGSRQQTTDNRGPGGRKEQTANGKQQAANGKRQTEAGRLTALGDAAEATSLRPGFGGDAAGGEAVSGVVGSRGGRVRLGGDAHEDAGVGRGR